MIDAHIHISHGNNCEYTLERIERFVQQACQKELIQIYLLEHTHQFSDFREMYQPIADFNPYQKDWLNRKMTASLDTYVHFVDRMKECHFPIDVRFGLEVCYIPGTESFLANILKRYPWDFITGSVHYIDGWGFDHKAEFWEGKDVNQLYQRYYQIMLQLVGCGFFTGLAHPDSIKCFGHAPDVDLTDTYENLAKALNQTRMYAEQSGGLALNYGFGELGLNPKMLKVWKARKVRLFTASDAHKPEHTGTHIRELQEIIES